MPDISKCEGTGCPLKETCWRYTSEANPYRQSYFCGSPYDEVKKSCDYYWETNISAKSETPNNGE